MARVKSAAHATSGEAHLEATDSASQEVAKVLSSMNQGSLDVIGSPSREGSGADAGYSDCDSKSNNSSDELTESDSGSTKRAKVISAAGMSFDFGSSTIGRVRIQTMEGPSYFAGIGAGASGRRSCGLRRPIRG
jgi:hypothetical protein